MYTIYIRPLDVMELHYTTITPQLLLNGTGLILILKKRKNRSFWTVKMNKQKTVIIEICWLTVLLSFLNSIFDTDGTYTRLLPGLVSDSKFALCAPRRRFFWYLRPKMRLQFKTLIVHTHTQSHKSQITLKVYKCLKPITSKNADSSIDNTSARRICYRCRSPGGYRWDCEHRRCK